VEGEGLEAALGGEAGAQDPGEAGDVVGVLEQEVAEGVGDGAAAVAFDALEDVGVVADDEVGAVVEEGLGGAALVGRGVVGVLLAPVDEHDDEVVAGAGGGDDGAEEGVEVGGGEEGELGGAVEVGGVAAGCDGEDADLPVVAFDGLDAEQWGFCARGAERDEAELAEDDGRVEHALGAEVEGVVVGEAEGREAAVDEVLGHLLGGAEAVLGADRALVGEVAGQRRLEVADQEVGAHGLGDLGEGVVVGAGDRVEGVVAAVAAEDDVTDEGELDRGEGGGGRERWAVCWDRWAVRWDRWAV